MCTDCPATGECDSCGRDRADLGVTIAGIRAMIADKRGELAGLEEELRTLLAEAGRRPGDGSDQPALFQAEAQGSLFGGDPFAAGPEMRAATRLF